jgi:hypothetical protein
MLLAQVPVEVTVAVTPFFVILDTTLGAVRQHGNSLLTRCRLEIAARQKILDAAASRARAPDPAE